jgi:hypothetical protein
MIVKIFVDVISRFKLILPEHSNLAGETEEGANENTGGSQTSRISLNLKMSRAGLEPATHWLKASCSTN